MLVINPLQADTLNEALSKVLPGGYVVLYQGKQKSWWPHREGVVILSTDNQFLLNGRHPLYTGEWHSKHSDPEGVIIRLGKEYFLNGARPALTNQEMLDRKPSRLTVVRGEICRDGIPIYSGEWHAYQEHPDGVVIQRGNQIILNGTTLLYDDHWNSRWSVHPHGLAIDVWDEIRLYSTPK